MKVIGMFSGVGGIELGFEQAGYEIVWSNEIDKNAAETFRKNFNHKLVVDDIYNIKSEDLPDADVIVGGFPCQAFSVAGHRKGFEDERGVVFFQMARIIREKSPRVIMIENVKNLLGHDNGNTYKVIHESLSSYGYKIKTMVLNGSEYGNVPQNRERVYIVGFKNSGDYNNFRGVEPEILTKKISDIVDYNEKKDEKYYYRKSSCKFYDELETSIVKRETLYQWRRSYVRENKSNLCPTLTASMGTGGNNVPLILTRHGIRKLTPKECFMFQGFPDNYVLPEQLAQSHLYKQAGNSVVVPVIKKIAEEIMIAVDRTDREKSLSIVDFVKKEDVVVSVSDQSISC